METAKNGYDLFQKVQNHKNDMQIDLILLDLHMPIMNGFDACQNICKLYDLKNRSAVIMSQNDED